MDFLKGRRECECTGQHPVKTSRMIAAVGHHGLDMLLGIFNAPADFRPRLSPHIDGDTHEVQRADVFLESALPIMFEEPRPSVEFKPAMERKTFLAILLLKHVVFATVHRIHRPQFPTRFMIGNLVLGLAQPPTDDGEIHEDSLKERVTAQRQLCAIIPSAMYHPPPVWRL